MADEFENYVRQKIEGVRRFRTNLEAIIAKYDKPFADSDVIDLNDMSIVENKGHLKRKKNASHFGHSNLAITTIRDFSSIYSSEAETTTIVSDSTRVTSGYETLEKTINQTLDAAINDTISHRKEQIELRREGDSVLIMADDGIHDDIYYPDLLNSEIAEEPSDAESISESESDEWADVEETVSSGVETEDPNVFSNSKSPIAARNLVKTSFESENNSTLHSLKKPNVCTDKQSFSSKTIHSGSGTLSIVQTDCKSKDNYHHVFNSHGKTSVQNSEATFSNPRKSAQSSCFENKRFDVQKPKVGNQNSGHFLSLKTSAPNQSPCFRDQKSDAQNPEINLQNPRRHFQSLKTGAQSPKICLMSQRSDVQSLKLVSQSSKLSFVSQTTGLQSPKLDMNCSPKQSSQVPRMDYESPKPCFHSPRNSPRRAVQSAVNIHSPRLTNQDIHDILMSPEPFSISLLHSKRSKITTASPHTNSSHPHTNSARPHTNSASLHNSISLQTKSAGSQPNSPSSYTNMPQRCHSPCVGAGKMSIRDALELARKSAPPKLKGQGVPLPLKSKKRLVLGRLDDYETKSKMNETLVDNSVSHVSGKRTDSIHGWLKSKVAGIGPPLAESTQLTKTVLADDQNAASSNFKKQNKIHVGLPQAESTRISEKNETVETSFSLFQKHKVEVHARRRVFGKKMLQKSGNRHKIHTSFQTQNILGSLTFNNPSQTAETIDSHSSGTSSMLKSGFCRQIINKSSEPPYPSEAHIKAPRPVVNSPVSKQSGVPIQPLKKTTRYMPCKNEAMYYYHEPSQTEPVQGTISPDQDLHTTPERTKLQQGQTRQLNAQMTGHGACHNFLSPSQLFRKLQLQSPNAPQKQHFSDDAQQKQNFPNTAQQKQNFHNSAQQKQTLSSGSQQKQTFSKSAQHQQKFPNSAQQKYHFSPGAQQKQILPNSAQCKQIFASDAQRTKTFSTSAQYATDIDKDSTTDPSYTSDADDNSDDRTDTDTDCNSLQMSNTVDVSEYLCEDVDTTVVQSEPNPVENTNLHTKKMTLKEQLELAKMNKLKKGRPIVQQPSGKEVDENQSKDVVHTMVQRQKFNLDGGAKIRDSDLPNIKTPKKSVARMQLASTPAKDSDTTFNISSMNLSYISKTSTHIEREKNFVSDVESLSSEEGMEVDVTVLQDKTLQRMQPANCKEQPNHGKNADVLAKGRYQNEGYNEREKEKMRNLQKPGFVMDREFENKRMADIENVVESATLPTSEMDLHQSVVEWLNSSDEKLRCGSSPNNRTCRSVKPKSQKEVSSNVFSQKKAGNNKEGKSVDTTQSRQKSQTKNAKMPDVYDFAMSDSSDEDTITVKLKSRSKDKNGKKIDNRYVGVNRRLNNMRQGQPNGLDSSQMYRFGRHSNASGERNNIAMVSSASDCESGPISNAKRQACSPDLYDGMGNICLPRNSENDEEVACVESPKKKKKMANNFENEFRQKINYGNEAPKHAPTIQYNKIKKLASKRSSQKESMNSPSKMEVCHGSKHCNKSFCFSCV